MMPMAERPCRRHSGSRKSRKILELASIPLSFSFALRCYSLGSKSEEKRLPTGE
jgi:hypothetical protein